MYILETDNLDFSYPDGYKALHGINFRVSQGEIVALLGANGCGKTTLFQHFNGLFKPSQGKVLLKEVPLGEMAGEEVFRTVGLVFQDPNDQLFAATVYEDVSYGPTNLGLSKDEITQRVEKALKMVEMWQHRDKSIHHLSYGQKKKVAIAGILSLGPEVMVMDEPTAGMDPRGVSNLMKLLLNIQQQTGCTVVISTHHVDLVPIFCQRVYVMNQGRIVLSGTPQEVFSDKKVIREAGLRLPRLAHLGEILVKDGLAINRLPLTIGQAREAVLDAVEGKVTERGQV
ncbi:MAG: ATP-binding cassette domain-containing protein [Clostridia bacterium]|nr:ATP-binding cassette domain-containing protein [Clostridia bacterium]